MSSPNAHSALTLVPLLSTTLTRNLRVVDQPHQGFVFFFVPFLHLLDAEGRSKVAFVLYSPSEDCCSWSCIDSRVNIILWPVIRIQRHLAKSKLAVVRAREPFVPVAHAF